ncbi:MAG: hypothetical protein AMXMBFR66_14380 [Pseudomonadota bacterium]
MPNRRRRGGARAAPSGGARPGPCSGARPAPSRVALAAALAVALAGTSARAADDDALALTSSAEPAAPTASPLRLALEAGGGTLWDHWQDRSVAARRVAVDLRYAQPIGGGWRVALSDRLDHVHPMPGGQPDTLNSLREAYAGWQADDAATVLDLGRVNYRNGPAFGFNPTDFLRSGALRTITTADPVALRENRMGTAMLRLGRRWGDAGLSAVLAPKIAEAPNRNGSSADFGATNDRARLLLVADARFSDRLSSGALRTITTADPVALRENRMGTAMLRLGRRWGDAGLSAVLAPKIAEAPNRNGSSADFGATNDRARLLLVADARFSDRLSGQLLALAARHQGPQWGLNLTALASDAMVVYAEYAQGNERSLIDTLAAAAGGAGGAPAARQRKAALGLTYTLPSKLSITLEADYNSRGLRSGEFASWLAQGPAAYFAYAALTQPSQELGSRRAWLAYVTQKELGLKQLDLTALVRQNAEDRSTLGWLELRYHWPRFDVALQLQAASGSARTEFGAMPYRRVAQVLATAYY